MTKFAKIFFEEAQKYQISIPYFCSYVTQKQTGTLV